MGADSSGSLQGDVGPPGHEGEQGQEGIRVSD